MPVKLMARKIGCGKCCWCGTSITNLAMHACTGEEEHAVHCSEISECYA